MSRRSRPSEDLTRRGAPRKIEARPCFTRRDSSRTRPSTDGRVRHARSAARRVRRRFSDSCPERRSSRIDLEFDTWSLERCFAARVRRASDVRVPRATDAAFTVGGEMDHSKLNAHTPIRPPLGIFFWIWNPTHESQGERCDWPLRKTPAKNERRSGVVNLEKSPIAIVPAVCN